MYRHLGQTSTAQPKSSFLIERAEPKSADPERKPAILICLVLSGHSRFPGGARWLYVTGNQAVAKCVFWLFFADFPWRTWDHTR
jgi:hypothetical protein